MDEWKLEIRKVNNGYVLRGKFGDSELITEEVIEEKDEDIYSQDSNRYLLAYDLTAMKDVLYLIMEYFGTFHSKHNRRNLEVRIIDENNKEIED